MKANWIATLTMGAFLVGTFLILQSCSEVPQCPLCERDVHQGMRVTITHNKIPMQTCCMACALTFKKQTQNVEIKNATDFISGTSVVAANAIYVVSSDVSPCTQDPKVQKFIREPHATLHSCYDRCEPGILAFRGWSDAEKFRQEHGGVIREFKKLPEVIAVKGDHQHD